MPVMPAAAGSRGPAARTPQISLWIAWPVAQNACGYPIWTVSWPARQIHEFDVAGTSGQRLVIVPAPAHQPVPQKGSQP
jgi:hypothetical protein